MSEAAPTESARPAWGLVDGTGEHSQNPEDWPRETPSAEPSVPHPEADLRRLKHVIKALPEGDPVRQLIEGEPDFLPLAVLAAKADSWVLLLLRRGD